MGNLNHNLSNSLFPLTRQKVLTLLFSHPEQNFHTKEIITYSKAGTGAVQRELSRLTEAELITMKVLGNQKRYQANALSPIFNELRGIVLKTFGLKNHIETTLTALKTQIKIAFIYGSTANQTDTATSDIDLLIIADDLDYSKLYQHLSKTSLELRREINPTIYTTLEWQKKIRQNNHFVAKIYEQEKLFIIGTHEKLTELGKPS